MILNENPNISNDIEKRIEEQEDELMLLFKNMINAFVLFSSVFDENGKFISYRFIYINDAYERITGVKKEEVKGKTVHEVWPETEPEWIKKYGNVVVTGKSDSFEMYHGPTKKFYYCNVYRPFHDNKRFCVIFDDITERRKNEIILKKTLKETEEKEIELRAYNEELETTSDALKESFDLQEVNAKLDEQKQELQLKNEEYEALNEELRQTNEELQRAKEISEKNENLFYNLFNNLNSGVAVYEVIDDGKDFIFKYFNKTAERIDNQKSEELIGKSIFEVRPDVERFGLIDSFRHVLNTKKPFFQPVNTYKDTKIEGYYTNYIFLLPKNELVVVFDDVTNEKKNEFRLLKAKAKAEEAALFASSITEQSPQIIYIYDLETLSNSFINKNLREYLGYKKGEVPENDSELMNLLIHPDDVDQFYYEEQIQNWTESYIHKYEYRLKDSEGKWRWFSGQEKEFKRKNGKILNIIGVVSDITDLKNHQFEIIKAKDKAEKDQKLLLQKNKEIELYNDRLESLLKISQYQTTSKQELLDFALEESIKLTNSKIGYIYFYDEIKKEFELNTWSKEVMKNCEVINYETIYELEKTGLWAEAVRQKKPIITNDFQAFNPLKKGLPEGHVNIYKFLTIPVFVDDKIVAVAGVANKENDYNKQDIRQLSLLMDSVWKISERISLIKDLEIAKNKAVESDRLKTAFLQNVSHEIRTPLNAICGFSDMLIDDTFSVEKRRSFVSIIQNSSQKLLEIVTDILTISALETNQEKVKIEEVDINEMLIELLAKYKVATSNHNISLYSKQGLTNKDAKIFTDKEKLLRVFNNLLSNAVKFTSIGTIEFGYELKNKELLFYVKDSGIGIKPEYQDLIFERFRQADKTIQQDYGGTGLGLAISKGYVELLGGKLTLESELDNGTTFYFSIPYKPVNIIDDNKKDKKTVLIAEDEEFNFLFLEELLLELDVKIIHAKNGEEAVEIFNKNRNIDLVLMDIKMPKMDGYTATKLIKEKNPNMPIIAQTAYALNQEIERYGDVFDDYLSKPIKAQQLFQKVQNYFKKDE